VKSVSVALAAHLAGETATLATCWLITLTNGTVKAFTDHDRDITFDGHTYQAATGYNPSDVATSSDLNVDNLEIVGLLNSPSITEADLLAGLWDHAAFEIFVVNWVDLTMGKMIERKGTLGEVSLERGQFKAELRGLMQAYTRSLGRVEGPGCDANLGDSRCKVRLAPPTWEAGTGYAAIVIGDAALGSIVSPTVENGYIFACTTSGTSGGSEPVWNAVVDGTTADGSVVWTARRALTVTGTVDAVNDDALTIYDAARNEPGPTDTRAVTAVSNANPGVVSYATAFDPPLTEGESVVLSGIVGPSAVNVLVIVRNPGATSFELGVDTTDTTDYPAYVSGGTVSRFGDSGHFDGGILTMNAGPNDGFSREIKSYVPGQFTLHLSFPYAVSAGEDYTAVAGCDKSLATCRDRFFNVYNMRAMPYLPGTDKIVQVGRRN